MKTLEDIDLNLLLLLHWLLEEESVTKAARHMGISQPAASHGLQRLRKLFGDELLVRAGRKLVVSKFAQSMRLDLQISVQRLRKVAQAKDIFTSETHTGDVTIACNDYLASLTAAKWANVVSQHAPHSAAIWRPLDLSVGDNLASGAVDLILAPYAIRDLMDKHAMSQDMVIKPLLEDKFVIFGPKHHPLISNANITLLDFANTEQVLVSPEGKGDGIVDKLLAEKGMSRSIKQRSWSFLHSAELALAADLIVVLPKRLACLRSEGGYKPLPLDMPPLGSFIGWHASRTSDLAHMWFRRALIASFSTA